MAADGSGTAQEAEAPSGALRPAQRARRFKTPRTIVALMLREMQTTYGKNAGGYAWALLEPIGGIAVLAFVLTVIRLRIPGLGTNLPLFIASGLLMLTMFLALSNRISQCVAFSKPLLFYPGVRYVDAIIARFLLNAITQLLVLYIVIMGIILIYDLRLILRMEWILLAVGLSWILALGVGVMNAFLVGMAPVWQQVWSIVTRPLFLVSTVFYTFESVPPAWRDVLWWNPLVHVVGFMRRGLYPTYDADWASWIYVAVLGATLLVLGLLFLYRFHRRILEF
jgi:capsular polysaccharide transport system permease protein